MSSTLRNVVLLLVVWLLQIVGHFAEEKNKHICDKIADGDQLDFRGVLKYVDHVRVVEGRLTYLLNISNFRRSALEKYNLLQVYQATEEETGLSGSSDGARSDVSMSANGNPFGGGAGNNAFWTPKGGKNLETESDQDFFRDQILTGGKPAFNNGKDGPFWLVDGNKPTAKSRSVVASRSTDLDRSSLSKCAPLNKKAITAHRAQWVVPTECHREWATESTTDKPYKRVNLLVGYPPGKEGNVVWRHHTFTDGSSQLEDKHRVRQEDRVVQAKPPMWDADAVADHQVLSFIGNGYTASGYMMHFNQYIPTAAAVVTGEGRAVVERRRVVLTPLYFWQNMNDELNPMTLPTVDERGYMKIPDVVRDKAYFIETDEARTKAIFVRAKPSKDGVVEVAKGDNDRDLFLNLPFGFIHGRGIESPNMMVYLWDRFGTVMLAFRYQPLTTDEDRIEVPLLTERPLTDFMICAPAAKLGITGQRKNCQSSSQYVAGARTMNLGEMGLNDSNGGGLSGWKLALVLVGVALIALTVTFLVVRVLRRRGKSAGGSSSSGAGRGSKKVSSSRKQSSKTSTKGSKKATTTSSSSSTNNNNNKRKVSTKSNRRVSGKKSSSSAKKKTSVSRK